MTTEERLENLERELAETKAQAARAKRRNRWLLGGVLLAAGAFALAWIVAGMANRAQAQGRGVAPIIIARGLVLVDENGQTRAVLTASKAGSGMGLRDENGVERASLDVAKEGSVMTLSDANGRSRIALSVTRSGSWLWVHDQNGKVIWRAP